MHSATSYPVFEGTMGSEMDAAVSAYGETMLIFPAIVLFVWLAIGLIIMRNEEADDGR